MVTQVGIAGCGLMGSAIADTNLQAGFDVVIFDIKERQLSNAKEKLDKKAEILRFKHKVKTICIVADFSNALFEKNFF